MNTEEAVRTTRKEAARAKQDKWISQIIKAEAKRAVRAARADRRKKSELANAEIVMEGKSTTKRKAVRRTRSRKHRAKFVV